MLRQASIQANSLCRFSVSIPFSRAQQIRSLSSITRTSPHPSSPRWFRPIPTEQSRRTVTTSSSSTSAKPVNSKPQSTSQKFTKLDIGHKDKHVDLSNGLQDPLPDAPSVNSANDPVDWSRSFHGLSATPFSKEASEILLAPIPPEEVEVKPDGIVYLPEIKYRRILNRAFGPGAWGLAPRGETIVTPKNVTREYGLVVHGRLVSVARGEQQYFDPESIPTATEGCKSNALMRCCKDLGIASDLWDPVYLRKFMANHAKEVWVEHITTKKKKKIFQRKDVMQVPYPWKETKA